jgi:putative nucleotidyltransferase with HDIG domain
VRPAQPLDARLLEEAVEQFPARDESRRRLSAASERTNPRDLLAVIESDVALTLALLRLANRSPRGGSVASVRDALRAVPSASVRALAKTVPAFSVFRSTTPWCEVPERFRLHALATHDAARRLATALDTDNGVDLDELLTAALIHDVGRLALAAAEGAAQIHGDRQTPEARIASERDALGTDHAALGADLCRRWRFPESLCEAVERHHDPAANGIALWLRAADMLAHYGRGQPIELDELASCVARFGADEQQLGTLLYELPHPIDVGPREVDPCPLSEREVAVLRQLAAGKLPKQIAAQLGVSPSTVRSHLHRVYARIGAADRTQAVMLAAERGWV